MGPSTTIITKEYLASFYELFCSQPDKVASGVKLVECYGIGLESRSGIGASTDERNNLLSMSMAPIFQRGANSAEQVDDELVGSSREGSIGEVRVLQQQS